MELSKQVCSLESAKKLKELGVKVQGAFIWCDVVHPEDIGIREALLYVNNELFTELPLTDFTNQDLIDAYEGEEEYDSECIYNAYTSSELGEMLPVRFATYRTSDNRYHTIMLNELELPEEWYLRELQSTDAESKAQTLIFMLEHGMITVEEINKEAK